MFRDDRPPPLQVPPGAFTPPAGAAVDADGRVGCVGCGVRLPMAGADVVGQGYRCPPCSQRAQIAELHGHSDAGAHFSPTDRTRLRAAGTRQILLGVLALMGALVAIAALSERSGANAAAALGVVGVGLLVTGFRQHHAAG